MCYKRVCKKLAMFLLPCVMGAGCSLDKGSSGDLPPQNVFLEVQGCKGDPEQDQAGTISYTVIVPFDLSMMETRLEVVRGEMDLVLGTENPPSDYFSFGRGPGTQKIIVGSQSREPMMGRPWFVQLVSPFEILDACEDEDDPDWRLMVRRSSGRIEGNVLLAQEGQVPACTPGNCTPESIQVEVPQDALSMEFTLESLQGDADLLVGLGGERESLASLNPGTGYDIAVLDPEECVPLRGQSLSILLESWQQTTDYRLQVVYVAGELEEEEVPL